MKNTERMYKSIVQQTRRYIDLNGFKSVLIGVSGGIDSAIVATIAADAIGGENVYGVAMPSIYSSDHSLIDAEELMKNLKGHYRIIPIKDMVEAFEKNIQVDGIAAENLQSRVRGTVLMSLSNQEGHLVLAPGNRSECLVGYSTIYGDSVGGYAPIKNVFKTDVYKLAEWRNSQTDSPIPVSSIMKPPSAELRPDQKDNDSLPDYGILDSFLTEYVDDGKTKKYLIEKYGKEVSEKIIHLFNSSSWKRKQYPDGPILNLK